MILSSIQQSQSLLIKEDLFTKSWSKFDIDSRMELRGSNKGALLKKIKAQALEWTKEEAQHLDQIFRQLNDILLKQQFQLHLPKEIPIIKSTMLEEGGAMGYTRSNYIVLNKSICSKPDKYIQKLLIHELFHVLTRNHPAFRKAMYALIGFKLMSSISYPESIKDFRITNPDAPQTDSYIMLEIEGKTTPCMMILYANKPYEGGRFFEYLQTGFLQIKTDLSGVAFQHNQPIIHSLEEVSNFYKQVGRNTNYIIHPEEILADNFAFAVLGEEGLKDEWLTKKIKRLLLK